ncbi:MAG: dTDP-4-dehydrorhamnose reductase, partial [Planctomycetota bacterium]
MRTLIIGANGQLGSDLLARVPGDVRGAMRPGLDVCDEESVAQAMREHRPDAVVNCAAQTNVDGCESAGGEAFAVNAAGALHVARQCALAGAYLVHISTDYVFGDDAQRHAPYVECDAPGPVNVYGASKLAGETLVAAYAPSAAIVRTSGLYGRVGARGKGGNFVETMLRLCAGERPIRVVADQRLSPTSTWALAGTVAELLSVKPRGVVHLAAANDCTWHEFACEIVHSVDPRRTVEAIPSAAYPTPARRPTYSVLGSE